MGLSVNGIATLTRDADVRKSDKGAWINFGIAVRRNGFGEGQQDTDFFEAVHYVKNDETKLLAALKKGTHIYVDRAEMRADKYEREGQPRTSYKVRIFNFLFIGGMVNASAEKETKAEAKPAPTKPITKSAPVKEEKTEADLYYEDDIPDEVAPF